MGETPDSGEWATERDAARVPLPEKLAESLTLNLALDKAPDRLSQAAQLLSVPPQLQGDADEESNPL